MPSKSERRLIRQWEQQLIDDYREYRSRVLLEPLYTQFQQWSNHQMNSEDLFQAIHLVHKENQLRFTFFAHKREELVQNIQFDPWFDEWLERHPAPVGADILPPELKPEFSDEIIDESGAGSADPTP